MKLKELVYPKKLVILADREFGRKAFLRFLKKKGIYWVIRHPKHSWPPEEGEGLEIPGAEEPYLLSWRLPEELEGFNPAKLYLRRMSIEESFRDAKSLLKLVELVNRIKDSQVKEGIAFLVFASLGFSVRVAEIALKAPYGLLGSLPKGFLGLFKRGYYSLIYLGRLCLMRVDKLKGARGLRINLEFTDT